MATIERRSGKYGVSWRAAVCVKGVRKTATFDTKSQAYAWAEEVEHRLRNGLPLPGELPDKDMDFAEAARRYEEEAGRRRKANTRIMYRYCVVRLTRAFAGKTLRGITRKDIVDYRDARKMVVGPASIIHDFSFLRGIYKAARLEWGINVECPVQDVAPPKPPHNREPILHQEEIEKLLDWCCVSASENLYSFVLLLLHTAMRPSEAATLKWEQVKLRERVLLLTNTKTGTPRRVPLTKAAVAALERLSREQTATKGEGAEKGKEPGGFVFFPADYKLPNIASSYFKHAFATACKNAGLKNISLYSIRHIAASYLLMNGVDIRTVADIMGHAQISMTMKYTHLLDRHKVEAIDRIGHLGI